MGIRLGGPLPPSWSEHKAQREFEERWHDIIALLDGRTLPPVLEAAFPTERPEPRERRFRRRLRMGGGERKP